VNRVSVWHHGLGPTPDSVNGVDQTVWALGAEQARRGHRVTFLTGGSPQQLAEARVRGIRLLPIKDAQSEAPPDLLHMHAAFIPAQAKLGAWALRHSIPYVITPHGGVAPEVLRRGRLKKSTYARLFERPRFRRAAATTAVLEPERREIRDFIGHDRPSVFVIPNAMQAAPAEVPIIACEDVVFLGRLDTVHKGLDRLADYAAGMPDVTFGIYGRLSGRSRDALPDFPANVTLRDPVYGLQKWSVVRSAAVYMHLSRWEVFGLSVFEAMMVGTPPIVSKEMHVAPLVQSWGGLAVDASRPADWVERVRELIDGRADRSPLKDMARSASSMTQVEKVADQFDSAYETVLGSKPARFSSHP
jgi:glycosyltransferase involved in cell wall biosynthesis